MPIGFELALRSCLQKDPKKRLRDVGDLRLAIEGQFEPRIKPVGSGQASRWCRSVTVGGLVTATVVAGLAAALLFFPASEFAPSIPVERFPELGGREPISVGGGRSARWSATGKELFYRRLDGAMMVVPIGTDDAARRLMPGTASVLFEGSNYFLEAGPWADYDVSPAGERFLMIKTREATSEGEDRPQVILVQHWTEELKRLVSTDR